MNTITHNFISSVKTAMNILSSYEDKMDEMSNIICLSFINYFNEYPIFKEVNKDDKIVRLVISKIFLDDNDQIRVDAQLYNKVMQNVNRAHIDAINAILNKYKNDIYSLIVGSTNNRERTMFFETIPVIASQISLIWGHPTVNKDGIVVNMRLY